MIDILLATFNGEKYLATQIESIISQTYCHWNLLIHDDGSDDKTVEIIKVYVREYPDKIFLIEEGPISLGAKNNFAFLLAKSKAKYIMFCDQDDIWFPNKVEQTFNVMTALEESSTNNAALGVFTDQRIVDSDLQVISNSAWTYQRNGPIFINDVRYLALRNYITGCTLMINSRAKDLSLPIHANAIMHDWWIGLSVLKNGGCLKAITSPTVLYRQHGDNVVGTTKFRLSFILGKLLRVKTLIQDQILVYRQAKALGIEISIIGYFMFKLKIIFSLILR